MISQVIREIKKSGGTISLDELNRRLGIERSALEGMLEYCVRRGILRSDNAENGEFGCGETHGGCGSSCAGYQGCPFVVNMPKMYELGIDEKGK